MSLGGFAVGALCLAVALGCAVYSGARLTRASLAHLRGVERALAAALISTCAFALSVLVPAMLGILTRGTQLACAGALAGVVALIQPRRESAESEAATDKRRGPEAGIAAVAALILLAWLVGELLHAGTAVPTSTDAISYDLPVIGRWIQSGSIWPVTELFPLQTHGTYPQSANLILAGFILPFHNDAFFRLPAYASLLLTAAASFAVGRAAGASRTSSALAALGFLAVPTVLWDAELGGADAIALAAFTAGLVFLVRRTRTKRTSDLVLAGIGLGLAAGSRWYFSSTVAVLVVFWGLVTVVRGFPLASAGASVGTGAREAKNRRTLAGPRVRAAGGLLVVALATSGFWLIRNWVKTDDPLFPVRIQIAGTTVWGAPHDIYRAISGYSIANYLGDRSVLSHYIVPALRKAMGLGGLLVVIAAAAGGVAGVLRTRQKGWQSSTVVLLVLTSLLLAIVYVLTPYSAFGLKDRPSLAWVNVRYALPALGVAVPAAAVAVSWWPRWARVTFAVGVLAAAFLGIHEADRVLGTSHADLAGGLAIALAALVVTWLVRLRSARRAASQRNRRRLLATAAVAAVAVVAGGYALQHRLNASRYAAYDRTFAWVQQHPAPLRIGLAGSFNFDGVSPAWAMYGPRLENAVAFVGRLPGGYLRQYTSQARWLRAVRKGHFHVLEIFTGGPPYPTTDYEVHWAAAAHFPVIIRSSRFELVRVDTAPLVAGGAGGA